MSDTPRTESFIATCGDYEKWPDYRYRLHNFARSLEREIDALIHDNARLLESLNTEAKERCRLEDENAAFRAEVERLRKDAERYRHMRANFNRLQSALPERTPDPDKLDRMIDAALKGTS